MGISQVLQNVSSQPWHIWASLPIVVPLVYIDTVVTTVRTVSHLCPRYCLRYEGLWGFGRCLQLRSVEPPARWHFCTANVAT